MRIWFALFSALAASFLLAASVPDCRAAEGAHRVQTGKISYYSDRFHGRTTANGEKYDKNAFTAASRTLPFGTVVKATNLSNGRSVLLRINDRGPVNKKWSLDVSRAAATRLDMIRAGVVTARIEIVGDKTGLTTLPDSAFFLKVRSAKDRIEAEEAAEALRSAARRAGNEGTPVRVFSEGASKGGTRHFAGAGPFEKYGDAFEAAKGFGPDAEIAWLPLSEAEAVPVAEAEEAAPEVEAD